MNLAHLFLRAKAMLLLVAGRRAAAESVFGDMVRRWPGDPYALSSRAHLRMQRSDKIAALDDLRTLVTKHPERSAADWFNYAFVLEQLDRLGDAEAAFRKAVALDDKLDRAWYGLGLTLIRAQRYDEAAKALERTTQLQPMSPHGWYQLARVHVDRQSPEKALKVIRHLKTFEPKVAEQLERETGLKA
jgi:tetratricopeptide (TPR) repeat protein